MAGGVQREREGKPQEKLMTISRLEKTMENVYCVIMLLLVAHWYSCVVPLQPFGLGVVKLPKTEAFFFAAFVEKSNFRATLC